MPSPLVTGPVTIFLVVLAIILLVPLLLQRLKIPYVIGIILAGVAVGPHGFNIVAKDMSFEVFGQVGILYLMFLAGLEIDMYNLKKNLSKGLTFGLLTFIIPFVLGVVAAIMGLKMGLLGAMLLASMFSAHTLLAYPIVQRFGLTKAPSVVIAVAGTIITVLLSLIVLAAVGSVYRDHHFSVLSIVRIVVVVAVFCTLVGQLYPRITRWFFRRYSERIAQFVYVLAMTFLAAAVAGWCGIEGVFGAFFAGLVLGRFVPARSPLMSRLEFVGNAIFIPYFLIGVGMMINLHVVFDGYDTLYAAAVMSGVAIVSKWLAAALTQRVFHMTSNQRSILYQLSNAHTAVALAVVTIGYQMHIFGEDILNATVVMILVTCTVSSVGTERAARRLKLKMLSGTIDPSKQPGTADNPPHTLVTVSNPVTATQLVDLALLMRGSDLPDSPLYALHVRNDNSTQAIAMARASLETAEKAASAVDATLTPIDRYDNNVVTGVLNTMAERNISEVIIGLHRRTTIVDSFLGAKIEQLLVSTGKMVVITRCFIPVNTMTRIVVYVPQKAQFETGFRRWVEALASLSRELGCRIVFWCFPDTRRYITTVLVHGHFLIHTEFNDLSRADDYVLLPSQVLDDDLVVVVTARRASVSFDPEMDSLPEFMQRYLEHNNLIVIYPEQFGREPDWETMASTMSADFVATPSPLLLRLRALLHRLTTRHR